MSSQLNRVIACAFLDRSQIVSVTQDDLLRLLFLCMSRYVLIRLPDIWAHFVVKGLFITADKQSQNKIDKANKDVGSQYKSTKADAA